MGHFHQWVQWVILMVHASDVPFSPKAVAKTVLIAHIATLITQTVCVCVSAGRLGVACSKRMVRSHGFQRWFHPTTHRRAMMRIMSRRCQPPLAVLRSTTFRVLTLPRTPQCILPKNKIHWEVIIQLKTMVLILRQKGLPRLLVRMMKDLHWTAMLGMLAQL